MTGPTAMPAPTAAMVFAAGFGTRMGALTAARPKPLVPVAGRALLDHALALVQAAGLRPVVNTHYLAGQVADHLSGRGIALSHEPEILDTGGGLRAALPLLGEGPVATLNSDAVWTGPNPFDTLRAAWDPARMEALLLLVPLARARERRGGGDFALDAAGRISWGGDLVYTGAQFLQVAALDAVAAPAFSLLLVWEAMIARGTAFGVIHPGLWCDVGRPEGIAAAEAMLREETDGAAGGPGGPAAGSVPADAILTGTNTGSRSGDPGGASSDPHPGAGRGPGPSPPGRSPAMGRG